MDEANSWANVNVAGAVVEAGPAAPAPGLIWQIIGLIHHVVKVVLRFAVYDVPSYFVSYVASLLGRQLSITLPFSSLLLVSIALSLGGYALFRYRYLTVYSRLPPEQHRQEPKMNLFVDSEMDGSTKSGLSNYLDDFLSAIKVFGYLDRKVFHELTRHMRTYKLQKGETIKHKDIKGFGIVVEGSLQVLVKSTEGPHSDPVGSEIIDGERYQLLNEVKKGAPVSSLFTILSLFTEDVEIPQKGPIPSVPDMSSSQMDDSLSDLPLDGNETDESLSFDSAGHYRASSYGMSPPVLPSSPLSAVTNGLPPVPRVPPLSNPRDKPDFGIPGDRHTRPHRHQQNFHRAHSRRQSKRPKNDFEIMSEDVVSRASTNATIAIIPEEAFRKLTFKYPKATSHIVQLILTHVQRVTFRTCHHYLHMTSEIFKTEEALNSLAAYDLPGYLHDGAIRRLQEKSKESKSEPVVSLEPRKNRRSSVQVSSLAARQVVLEPDESHPGDLLSNVPLSRRQLGRGWAPPPSEYNLRKTGFTGDNETEDAVLRNALVDCIFKLLGFDGARLKERSLALSVESSPLIVPSDVRSRSMHRSNNFNLYGSFEGDNMSETGSSSNFDDDDSAGLSPYDSAQMEAAKFLEVAYYRKGTYLGHQDERCPGLFYVIDGVVEVGYTDKSGVYRELHTVKAGGVAGFLGSVLGYKSFSDIKAKSDVYVGLLPRQALERISDRNPMFYISVAKTLTNVLNRLILHLDFALEWVQVEAGNKVFVQGEDADALYFVLNGRLRSLTEENGKKAVVEEFGQGSSVGEIEVLTSSKYLNTLHAIRDSELARFPRSLFESLSMQHPSLTFEITRLLAARMRKQLGGDLYAESVEELSRSTFRTICILPVTSGLPVTEFAEKLLQGFHDTRRDAVLLNNATMLTYLGRNAFNKMGLLKLSGYLSDLEEKHQTVIYVADASAKSPWTQTCISQGDCILLLANAMAEPDVGEYERLLVKMKTTARTDLILLHPDRYVPPGSTVSWLQNRIWVHSHHHVQMDVEFAETSEPLGRGTLQKLRNKVQTLQSELITKYRSRRRHVYASSSAHKNDFNRLARILSGQAIGLVLGGGGARGIAHIGVIRALEESGVPIDFVGGTSIGSFVGGLFAKEYDLVPIYGRAKKFAGRVSSLWRMVLDLTYPATSYTTGHEFNRGIWKTFGDSRIEDFWLKFYANTTNITHSRMEIHDSGYSWRYIRASMSLAGLLPPLTDKGSMLLDGGYVDNLPVSEMRKLGAKVIFAVDVGSIDDTTPMEYGDTLSGTWVVLNRWNFFSQHPNVPNLAEIQQRLAYVSSVGALERAKATPGVLYMRPPIDNFATLDFGKFDEIFTIGSQYAYQKLEEWKKEGRLEGIHGMGSAKGTTPRRLARRNSI